MKYLPRIIDNEIEKRLKRTGGLLIEGPKWCGKTTTALQKTNSCVHVDDYLDLAQSQPHILLEDKETPVLVDEWQLAPQLWDSARRIIDERNSFSQFIFTGSSAPQKKPSHSGAGRFSPLRMHTMSLYESKESNGQISLKDLFDKGENVIKGTSSLDFKDGLLNALCRGGWPASLKVDVKYATEMSQDYLSLIERSNIADREGRQFHPEKLKMFLAALARNVATPVKISTLVEDVKERSGELHENTAYEYLNSLKELFIIEEQPSWKPSLRTKARLRSTPKRHFADPSLAAAALNATPDVLLEDLKTLGFLFESLCYRDCVVYAEPLNGTVYHYRDSSGDEIDNVVVLKDGRWGAIEVKWGKNQIDRAAKGLKRITSNINTQSTEEASFLAVIYAGEYAYTREDGVHVIPIGCLGP